MKLSVRGVLAAAFILGMCALCVRLGFWQLDRLEGRRARNAAVGAAGALPTLVLDSAALAAVAESPAAYVNRRVRVRGAYDPAGEVVLRGRAREGQPGVHLATPLRVEGGGGAVLVNRGWAPSPDGATVRRAPLAEPGAREVVGLLQEIPVTEDGGQPASAGGRDTTFRRLDLAAVRSRSPYAVLPLYVQQLPDAAPRDRPPFRVPPPELGEGPHLGYAIQWFSFAAIAVVGFLVVALRRKR